MQSNQSPVNVLKLITPFTGLLFLCLSFFSGDQAVYASAAPIVPLQDTISKDSAAKDTSVKLPYPLKDRKDFEEKKYNNPLDLKDPANLKKTTEYNPETGQYEQKETIGDLDYRKPRTLTLKELEKEYARQQQKDYFKERAKAQNFATGTLGSMRLPPIVKNLGLGTVDIRPTGSAELTFGGNFNTVRNPAFSARQQKNGQFVFNQKIQLNVNGSIGDRIKINTNYDTEATFDFENLTKINFVGKEDDIIKKIEVGNVGLPLNSSLISGGQNLFGVKAQLQFGRLTSTIIFSQQKGKTTETELQGGAQVTPFEIQADNYDVNRHYFLSQFFKDQYDYALSEQPLVKSKIQVTRVEVWVTNRTGSYDNARDILAFMDLAERHPYANGLSPVGGNEPDNNSNSLYNTTASDTNLIISKNAINLVKGKFPQMQQGVEYDLLNYARQLSQSEFTFHPYLGYISLNQALNNDEILAVSYEYTYNGTPHKVGTFGFEIGGTDKVLVVKMLKGNTIRTNLPIWDLMMKNIYSLGAYNIQPKDFKLNVIYADDPSGADLNYIPVQNDPNLSGIPLIQVLNVDRVNKQREFPNDGVFDYHEGTTVTSSNGRIIFPVREPFGEYLRSKFKDSILAEKYIYRSLYDSTRWLAQQDVSHNKFFLRGSYQGSNTSEISLNSLNVPQGSVKVTANGTPLVEGQDFIVDYVLGKVKIINTAILNSGAIIKVSAENNSLFNIQQKTLAGVRLDYTISKNAMVGATFMHLWERPLTPKVNIGDEPLLNTMFGFDGTFTKESRFITKMVDKLPFLETKEPSSITFSGEYAQIIPHNPRTIGQRGTSYIDDFEGAETPFDLKLSFNWHIAATPQGQPNVFNTGNGSILDINKKRGLLSWYTLDNLFFTNTSFTPSYLPPNFKTNHYTRSVEVKEVFPNKQLPQGTVPIIPTLDLVYYPKERGPYNYNVADLNTDGTLANPGSNWAGITRRIDNNDFEAANIDYLEIWVMDPFIYEKQQGVNNNNKGDLYIHFGSISEDVLPDNRKSFENGLPKTAVVEHVDTSYQVGMIPVGPTINNAFDNEPSSRPYQDVGLDGINSVQETGFFGAVYLDSIANKYGTSSGAYLRALADPSGDNYQYYRDKNGSAFEAAQPGIITRYKYYNGLEGNSTLEKVNENGSGSDRDMTPKAATTIPDDEDINRDFTLNLTEEYYQYKVPISLEDLRIGNGYVTDSVVTDVKMKNSNERVTWYQLKIPIRQFEKKIGGISDFKSIRFMRLAVSGFTDSIILRFAQLQLVRADWRRYTFSLQKPGLVIPVDPNDDTRFSVSTVNIEENGKRLPIPYVVPPGITREIDPTSQNVVQQNEQSVALNICNLKDGDARGAFKTTKLDIRNYKTLRMFIHAEGENLNTGDLTAFIRLGTDLEANYYEYEIPLTVTAPGSTLATAIWPSVNELAVDLEEFYATKQERYNQNFPMTALFSRYVGAHRISVIGLPDMSNVRVIMLGVRNPKTADELAHCGEVWFNELRVTELTNKGGQAAVARLVTKLADFGTFNASGGFSTIGFGGIDKKLNERSLNNTFQYDVSSSLELGRFFPNKLGITIPFFIGYNEIIVRPKFNPLNPDILLTTTLKTLRTEEEKNRVRKAAENYTSRYSLNFTNVRKTRTGNAKARIYDIENFYTTFAFTRMNRHDQYVEYNLAKTYHASLGYGYTFSPKPLEPFKWIGKNKHLLFISDLNLFLLPQTFNTRVDVDRLYSEQLNRNNDNFQAATFPLFDKNFTMTRYYDLKWDFTKNLKGDYTANTNARIDEPSGRIDNDSSRNIVTDNLMRFGRTTNYTQSANLNYTVPFSRIPTLNWMTLNLRYGSGFSWITAPPAYDSLGHTIQNSRTKAANLQLNMLTLYNKSKLLRDINASGPKQSQPKKTPPKKIAGKDDEEKEKAEKNKKAAVVPGPVATLARFVMMLKSVTVTATLTDGIVLPGFLAKPQYTGNNWDVNAPGLPFIFGSQNREIRKDLANRNLITRDDDLVTYYGENSTRSYNMKAMLEPFRDFKIELTGTYTKASNFQSNFRFDPATNNFIDIAGIENGSFSMSYNIWRTTFSKPAKRTYESKEFTAFEDNRYVIAQRQQNQHELVKGSGIDPITGFPLGFDRNSPDVMLPAFLAAYAGKNAANISLSPFQKLPNPNWRVTYTGLSKLAFFKRFFSSINIQHAYSSTYSPGYYQQSILYNTDVPTPGKSLIPKYTIRTVSLIERLSPLLSIDAQMNNGLGVRVEYKRERMVSLSLQAPQVTETRNQEFIVGANYRAKEFRIPFKIGGKKIKLENEVNFRLDFSVRDGITIVHKMDEDLHTPAAGNRIISIKPTIDYNISEKLNLKIFYDRRATQPYISSSFPTALTQFGINIRYTL